MTAFVEHAAPIEPSCRTDLPVPDVQPDVTTAALLADSTRSAIVAMLRTGPACVCELAGALGGTPQQREQPPGCAIPAWCAPPATLPTRGRLRGRPRRPASPALATGMQRIEILGPGCHTCHLLEQAAREAVALAGIEAEVVQVTEYGSTLAHGVVHTPGLVIDGRVVSAGRVPTPAAIAAWLTA